MADAPAPPPAIAGLDTAEPPQPPAPPPAIASLDAAAKPPQPHAPAAAVDAQLQTLIAQAMERNTAVRTHLAQRAEAAIAAMKDTLADLLVVANLARTTAAAVPGLHNVAHALHDLYAQSRAVQVNFEPEWQAAIAVMARANADVVAVAALADQAAVVDAPLAPLVLDESDRPEPVWPPPPRKWHLSNGDDEDDVEEQSEPDFVFDIQGPLLEDDEDDKDYVPGQDSDDDIDYDSDSTDEDPDGDMSNDASKYSNTSGDKDPGVPAGAPKDEGAKWQGP